DREKEFANTRSIVDKNSESARRLSTMADLNPEQAGGFGPRQAFEAGGVTGIGRSLAMRGVDKVAQALAGANAEARNLSLAEAISGNRQR
ncbi:hypothetical protein, partial [Aeromonas veronii]|uniref:hypothetical protein n=1 Tax=Aeromonas veronii TaxID=654 RepID=UPI00406C9B41